MISMIIFKIQINFLRRSKINILKMKKYTSVTEPRGKCTCLLKVFTCLGNPYFEFFSSFCLKIKC